MHPIMMKVHVYLEAVNRGEAEMPPAILDEAAAAFRNSMSRQFNSKGKRDTHLRMSNIGKPSCQILNAIRGTPAEPMPYNHPVKMAYGDAAEAMAIAIMKAAGVNIVAINEKASLRLVVDGVDEVINGTTDCTIDEGEGPQIWDIKSASSFAFTRKFANPYGYSAMLDSDPFGYIAQGYGYENGTGKPFAGWIAMNKESGEFAVLEVPQDGREADKAAALKRIENNISTVRRYTKSGEPIVRCFDDKPEVIRKVPTGNRVLDSTCSYCEFKNACWPGLKLEKSKASSAANPKLVYYTSIIED